MYGRGKMQVDIGIGRRIEEGGERGRAFVGEWMWVFGWSKVGRVGRVGRVGLALFGLLIGVRKVL